MQLVLGLVAITAAGRSALALEVVLVDRTSQATVAMADYPEDRSGNTVIVAWDGAPGDLTSGALMFRRERHGSTTSYVAIGGGPILVVDRGRHTLVSGTSVPVFEVAFAKDWDHPVQMVASQDIKLDIATLVGRYRTYEHIAVGREGKAEIDTAIRAPTDLADLKLKVTVDGKTLTFLNPVGSSSRSGGDYASAAKKVL